MAHGVLALSYVVEGDIDRLRVPVPQSAVMADKLWQHTCCEIFIACKGHPAYHEFNLAPSGAWAAYAFARYREAVPLAPDGLDPHIVVRRAANSLELDALIRLERLSPAYINAKLALALSAVIEDKDGSRSFWALAHGPGAPDFHRSEAFALELA